MSMSNKGLTKLIEECGELIQVAAKLIAYPDGHHPDGVGNLFDRLEAEIADVSAACTFVTYKMHLSHSTIDERTTVKVTTYLGWDQE